MKYSELESGSFGLCALPAKGPWFKCQPWVSVDDEFKMICFKPDVEIFPIIVGERFTFYPLRRGR